MGLIGVVLVCLFARGTLPLYDDALFFGRFARNFLAHGVFAWNPIDGPIHGNTSQLHQLVVTGLFAAFPGWGLWAGRVWSAASVVVAGLLLAQWAPTRAGRLPIWLALSSPIVLATVLSGMETALVLALGAGFIVGLGTGAHRRSPWLVAGGVVLLYLARPDTGLLTVVALGAAPWPIRRKMLALVLSGVGLALVLAVFYLLYGQALPTAFALKTGAGVIADARFIERSEAARLRHLGLFAVIAAPLLALALPAWRRTWRLLLPAGIFLSYQAFVTLDIMGLQARFFVPALPWLAASAALGSVHPAHQRVRIVTLGLMVGGVILGLVMAFLPSDQGWAIGRVPLGVYVAWLVASAMLLGPGPRGLPVRTVGILLAAIVAQLLAPGRATGPLSDEALVVRASRQATSWRGAVALRDCLGTDVRVFHSEIGVPGMLFPDGVVFDLGALMNPETAEAAFDIGVYCADIKPDAIFLPHPNYARLRTALEESRCLEDYVQLIERGSSPLFVRRDLVDRSDCLRAIAE